MPTNTQPPPLNEHHLHHLIEARSHLVAAIKIQEGQKSRLAAQILETLLAAGVDRHQMTTGTMAGSIVSIVKPDPRQVVSPEKLLGMGVNPDLIRAATVATAVKPYIRVDEPSTGKGAAAELTAPAPADDPPIPGPF